MYQQKKIYSFTNRLLIIYKPNLDFMVFLVFLLGVLCWTLIEYILHRFLGHVHKGKNFFKTEHVQHHAKFSYFAPAYKKAVSAAVVFSLSYLLLSLFAPTLMVLSFLIGLYGMYAIYELTHFRFHAKDPVAMPFVILRKHHFYHHFHNPKTNFGVTSRFWDKIFGTFKPVEKVRIPQKMAMQWLLDSNEVKEKYAADFYLA